ncbi:MAG: hypothetical protein AB8G77_00300 [Rhodothermales bacterium]
MNDTSSIQKIALLLLLIITFTGCDTVDPKTEDQQAPAVIPQEAFALNLDIFQQETPANKNSAAYTNWLSATVRAGVATYIGQAILEVPFELTAAIQHVPPVYNENAFVWAADTLVDGQLYGIALKAQIADNFVDWQMKVTGVVDETGVTFENFLLYSARTYTDADEGTFQVYFPTEAGSQQVMDGAYEINDEAGQTLSFNIPQDVEEIGGTAAIVNHYNDQVTLDLTGPHGGKHFIEWDTVTGAGSLIADDYNNGEKACWDETLQNVECEVVS